VNTHHLALSSSLLALVLAGCAGEPDPSGDEPLGEAEEAVENDNALNPNALNPNALNPDALNPNALNPNALTPAALGASALKAIKAPGAAGDLSRQLLKYTVSCALSSNQSFSFSWTDASSVVHDETYWGKLGLEPGWHWGPLSSAGQLYVSACLASRVNWYGVSVTISSRASLSVLDKTGTPELKSYPNIEGAFWGNLFSAAPSVRACYNKSNVAHSRAAKRDCAAGHLNADNTVSPCGPLEIIGPCETYCGAFNASNGLYPSCVDNPAVSSKVKTMSLITVGLP
jgi:hypothetical protein